MSVALGSVRRLKRPGLRGYTTETFTALVEDGLGRRWASISATVREVHSTTTITSMYGDQRKDP